MFIRLSIAMVERLPKPIIALSPLWLTVIGLFVGCGTAEQQPRDRYLTAPVFIRAMTPTAGGDTLTPIGLQFFEDTLYVAYQNESRLDLYTPSLEKVRAILFHDPEPVYPTSFVVTDSAVVAVDHPQGVVAVYDRQGRFQTSFGLLPDEKTRLSPSAVTFYGGVIYLADLALGRVLAISLTNAPEITEIGELILQIPRDSSQSIGSPSAVFITPDGRLLIGDTQEGAVRVFTCDGRPIYDFDPSVSEQPPAPLGFARDNIIDPSLQDSTSFDPSGIRQLGRIHVVDGNNAVVHVYNPLGRYLTSYPADGRLVGPVAIAIDRGRQRIYIADPLAGRIFIYRYERAGRAGG